MVEPSTASHFPPRIQSVHHQVFPGVGHVGMLNDPGSINYVAALIKSLVRKDNVRRLVAEQTEEAIPDIEIIF